MSEIKSEYKSLNEQNEYDTHFFKTSADLVVGLGRMKSTAYKVGDVVYTDTNNKIALKCVAAGVTSADELDLSNASVGDSIVDGAVDGSGNINKGVTWLVVNRDYEAEVYKLSNYRLANTAYTVGDTVAVPYHNDLQLVCTVAGTTSTEALDTTEVTVGDTLTDGGVTWVVAHIAKDYLPLSGGDFTKSATLRFKSDGTGYNFTVTPDARAYAGLYVEAADGKGARLVLRPVTSAQETGAFLIEAIDAESRTCLKGFPNGDFTWDDKPILVAQEQKLQNKGYCKLSNGMILQWLYQGACNGVKEITLPTPFSGNAYIVAATHWTEAYDTGSVVSIYGKTATTVTVRTPSSIGVMIIAIGW